MARRKVDPIIPVVNYFETAPVDAAKLALEVVSEIVRRRQPVVPARPAQPGSTRRIRKPATPAEVGG